ncbi:hypothetical protein HB825_05325 [Listeria booriae]|uniref:Uncharacterized protein n=1 Tax=Listeria booriae TaxID=1552123 RepID=A0A7X1CAS6_9LIST|nr:Imm59 family immunity protein [Listeria booriae]MBC1234179.1 hypothetical protein [Listeria booriae]MBC1247544.1 hypothetical protein [Listeria booriae]MBC1490622.1 hypothetical protein [Listeria booriae]MBC1503842.1 hypothetical protein [Listeria booriae]MBC1512212.1 hypothetical protein [Listeria booriae]
MKKIDENKTMLQQKISELGYDSLRVSIFNEPSENRMEWQTRIEYDNSTNDYRVYSLADRASVIGKIKSYSDYQEAADTFLTKLKLTVEYNKLRVKQNKNPEYQSPLWSE